MSYIFIPVLIDLSLSVIIILGLKLKLGRGSLSPAIEEKQARHIGGQPIGVRLNYHPAIESRLSLSNIGDQYVACRQDLLSLLADYYGDLLALNIKVLSLPLEEIRIAQGKQLYKLNVHIGGVEDFFDKLLQSSQKLSAFWEDLPGLAGANAQLCVCIKATREIFNQYAQDQVKCAVNMLASGKNNFASYAIQRPYEISRISTELHRQLMDSNDVLKKQSNTFIETLTDCLVLEF